MRTLLFAFAALGLFHQCFAIDYIITTFMKNNKQPLTEDAAKAANWAKLSDCSSSKFAGNRYLAPIAIPTMAILYDNNGNAAGMQHMFPIEEMVLPCDGTNPFYVKEVINSKVICTSTVYFTNPSSICTKGMPPKDADLILYTQKGDKYVNSEGTQPYYHLAANDARFQAERFFLGMGHHFTFKEAEPENCPMARPFQMLYASLNGKCRLTGYVSAHLTKTAERDGWEKPAPIPVRMILTNPAQCELDAAGKQQISTMHVFLRDSTRYCFSG